MPDEMTPGDIRERYGDLPYITPYERIVALCDEGADTVELHEFHARGRCAGGSAWEVYHYGRTSPLVRSARREGARNIFVCSAGRAELRLVPGVAGAGLEEVLVRGSEVEITYAGLAGGGIAATLCRGMAQGVLGAVVHDRGGGAALGRATLRLPLLRKLVVGVDDTDSEEKGATWSLANEVAYALEGEGLVAYLGHTIVQLFPDNPHKTTNCCSTAITAGVSLDDVPAFTEAFMRGIARGCYSDQCALAFFERVEVPGPLRAFSTDARQRMVEPREAESVGRECGIRFEDVTGPMGRIGALAAVGMHDDPDSAVVPHG